MSTTKVTISFTMTFTEAEMREKIDYWKAENLLPIEKPTPKNWGTVLAEIIKQQWDGYGEGAIYRSEISVTVQEG